MVPVNNQAYVNVCDRTPLHTWLKKMALRRRTESRRPVRGKKLSYKISELYKQTKCRECSVHITRMDFEKMLGKFTKVKIQYDKNISSSPLKSKYSKRIEIETPDDGESARLRTIENGMVMLRRSAFKKHPAKELLALSKPASKRISLVDKGVLKENNIINRSINIHPTIHKVNGARKGTLKCSHKLYKIIFVEPRGITTLEKNTTTFKEILPRLNKNILPSEEWTLELLPKIDHVYDRIAAELEGLMCINQNPDNSTEKIKQEEDFPSIMDILNEKPLLENEKRNMTTGIVSNDHESSLDNMKKVDSSDVEAMLTDNHENASQDIDDPCTENNGESNIGLSDSVDLIDSAKVDGMKRQGINVQEPTDNCETVCSTSDEKLEGLGKVTDQSQSNLQLPVCGNPAESPTKIVDSENKLSETKTKEDILCISDSKTLQNESCPEILVDTSLGLNTDDSKMMSTDEPDSTFEQTNNDTEQSKIENVKSSAEDIIKTLCPDENLSESNHTDENGLQKIVEMETSLSKPNDSKDVENNNTDLNSVTHVILKKTCPNQTDCFKSIQFDQTLEYKVQIQHKQVEFLGAPKFISSIEDLIVLLQIVNEANIDSYNVITL